MSEFPTVSIDDQLQLRVLDPEVRERSAGFVDDCQLLVSSECQWTTTLIEGITCTYPLSSPQSFQSVTEVKEFETVMSSINATKERLASDVERQRLRAIGRRVKLNQDSSSSESSEDALRREEAMLLERIEAKEGEMEEFSSYLDSLERAEREQMAEIDKLGVGLEESKT